MIFRLFLIFRACLCPRLLRQPKYRKKQSQQQPSSSSASSVSRSKKRSQILPSPEDAIGDVDCMNVMENFGYRDLIDSNEIWDHLQFSEVKTLKDIWKTRRMRGSQQVQKKRNQDEENYGFSFL
ncbi:B3 domain-containing transcription factor ABI3-like [Forsythia ovata]|uniref:B3 domain-containing transcription factor ABI3-like n=1 Tax=Forsythia ovata TaxID=205694 RepID=A0ABD1WPM3_9LAMI